MKIGIVCPASLPATQFGGILFLGVDLARELSNEKHQATIYTTDLDFANNPKTFNKKLPKEENIQNFKIKRSHVWFSIRLFFVNPGIYFRMMNGNDFSNIESDSIDFVFSMHSLERVPRNVLIKYFKDINRITSKNSFVFIQIPDCFYYESLNNDFTFISGCKLQNILSSFETKIDYTISTISPIIIGEKIEI